MGDDFVSRTLEMTSDTPSHPEGSNVGYAIGVVLVAVPRGYTLSFCPVRHTRLVFNHPTPDVTLSDTG